MLSEEIIKGQISNTLEKTDFDLGEKYEGKVRDNYSKDDRIIMITSDRISCFDRVIGTVPFKGQVLNQLATFWFDKTKDIVSNHIIDVPDPNLMVVKRCKPLPVEMVVRGYITGSLWRAYEKGEREIYGMILPDGMKKDQKFDNPIITPSTKAEKGDHDEPISKQEIIEKGLVPKEVYEKLEEISLALFDFGTKFLAENNLILVDTKYEFGMVGDDIVLMDEMHTPDSSRFWYADSYLELFEKGEEQRILDKEYVRQWLISQGYMGDGEIPTLIDEVKVEACMRYVKAFEQITGQDFKVTEEPILERMTRNLTEKKYL